MALNDILCNLDIYNYDYFQQEDVCRFCWKRNAFTDIFTKPSKNYTCDLKIELIEKIKVCLDVDFPHNTYPNKMCESCLSDIDKFYYFKIFCQETNRRLQDILKNNHKPLHDVMKVESIVHNVDLNLTSSFDDCYQEPDENFIDTDRKSTKIKSKQYKLKRSPTYCNICRLDLLNIESFVSHNSQCHGIEDGGLYKCFGCDKKFRNRKTRLGHEIHYCKGIKDGYKCTLCERFLPSRRMYEGHMRDHREKESVELPDEIFRCKLCYKLFKTRESLIEHKLNHSTEKKNFVCESCGRVFTRQDYLYKHKLTHTGEKQHVCPHCGFRATQRSSLVVHIRKHTGERPYSCDVCPQRCVSSSNLRAHRRRHLGVKHYECTICNKKYGYKVSLEEHISSTHAPSQSHSCGICGAEYTRAKGLKRHLATKHGKEKDKLDTKIDAFE